MSPRPRSWFWGPAAGALLVAAASVSVGLGLLPGVPLFDGLTPPPAYRWVHPPPELRRGNEAPDAATANVTLTAAGSEAANLETTDQQVLLMSPAGTFAPAPGQLAVSFTIDPMDPAAAPAPPAGLAVQGNAYRITASYEPSGATATAVQPVLLTLRYPVDATEVIRFAGTGWEVLPTTLESAALSVAATTQQFALFAAAGTGDHPARPRQTPAWAYAAAGLALLAVAVPTLRHRRPGRPPSRRR